MSNETDFVSAIGTILSGVFGVVAAFAACTSARAAKAANETLRESQHVSELREIGRLAAELLSEVRRAKSASKGLEVEYKTLFVFSGSEKHSSELQLTKELETRMQRLEKLGAHAKLFSDNQESLPSTCNSELTRVNLLLTRNRLECADLREEIEAEYNSIRERNNQYRNNSDFAK